MAALPGLFVARDSGGNGTTPTAARQALGGLIAKNPDGTIRTGVLADGQGPVVTGTAGMSYSVRKHVAVAKAAEINGPVLIPNDGPVAVSTTPAPGSNSRIDVIYVQQRFLSGDGGSESTNQPVIGVAQGATSATPSAPSIPTGAVEVGRATVTAGTTATSGLTITPGQWTVATGGSLPGADGRVPKSPILQVLSKRWGVDFNPSSHAPKRLSWTTTVSTSSAGIAAIVADLKTYFVGVASVQLTGSGGSDSLRSAKAVITGDTVEAYCYGPGGTGVVSSAVALDVTIDGWV